MLKDRRDATDRTSMDVDRPRPRVVARTLPLEVLAELLAAPVIRPAAVARGRARLASDERCPADAVASRLVEDLVGELFWRSRN